LFNFIYAKKELKMILYLENFDIHNIKLFFVGQILFLFVLLLIENYLNSISKY